MFNSPTNLQKTLEVLTYLTQQLTNVTNVVGIELLNEPANVASLEDVCECPSLSPLRYPTFH